MRKIYNFLFKRIEKKYLILSFLLMTIFSLTQVVTPYYVSLVFDELNERIYFSKLFMYSIAILLATIVNVLCARINSIIEIKFSNKLEKKISFEIFDHLNKMDGKFFSEFQTGEISNLLITDLKNINAPIKLIFSIIQNVLVVIVISAYLISINLYLFFGLMIIQIIMALFQRKVNKILDNQYKEFARLNSKFFENINPIINHPFDIIKHNLMFFFKKRFSVSQENVNDQNIKIVKTSSLGNSISQILNSISIVFIIIYGGWLVMIKSISIGQLVAFNLFSQRFISPLMQIAQSSQQLTSSLSSLERIVTFLDEPPRRSPTIFLKNVDEIEFLDVNFSYDDKLIIRNLSMKLKKGEILGIFGKSGSGKSTLVNILAGLLPIDYGDIIINGHYKLDSINILDNISFISQEPFLFNDTILNNIILEDVNYNEAKFSNVIKKSQLTGLIKTLNEGIETKVGENGYSVSGGEKQRIGIARALFQNSQIIILDEPTSMLDWENEKYILEYFSEIKKNYIIILITHNANNLKYADEVFYLKGKNDGDIDC